MTSAFINKEITPTPSDIKEALGNTYDIWQEFAAFTKRIYPGSSEKWHYTNEKNGWSFRISDKKRVLLYLLPRDGYFKVALVYGQKATDTILNSDIAPSIISEITNAKVYAEGRGIRIDVKDPALIPDIKELIRIKIAN